jgi:arginyl-tRNA synthetase
MRMENLLRKAVKEALLSIYSNEIDESHLQIQKTRKEFAGDLTLVVFPLVRLSGRSPEETS